VPISSPQDAGLEPLPRWLQLQSQRAPARRQPFGGGPLPPAPGVGQQSMGGEMTPLLAQEFMDSQQSGDVIDSPQQESPFRMASDRSGGKPPIRMAAAPAQAEPQCRPGTPCYAKQQAALARQLGVPEGSIITHIDGSPMGGSQYAIQTSRTQAQAPAMAQPRPAAQTTVASAPKAPSIAAMAEANARGMISTGEGMLGQASEQFKTDNPVTASNTAVSGRAATQAGYAGLQAVPGYALAERQLSANELNDEVTRRTQEQNLKAAWEQTLVGNNSTTDKAVRGVDMFYGQSPSQRAITAANAAHAALAAFPDSNASKAFDYQKTLGEFTGMALAYDVARHITNEGELTEQPGVNGGRAQVQFKYGGNIDHIDDAIMLRYWNEKDPKTNLRPTEDMLRAKMEADLAPILQREIGGFIREKYPTMSNREVERLALHSTVPVIDELYQFTNGMNARGNAGESWSQAVNYFTQRAAETMKAMGDENSKFKQ
jgi:hypothetical protein